MKTKNRIKHKTKPITDLVWVDIHSTNTSIGVHNPVAYGFIDPELLKFLNGFGLKSQYTIELISQSVWEKASK